MGITDFAHRGSDHFSCRGFLGPDEPALGNKILNALKAGDITHLVDDGEGQDGPDAGDRSQKVVILRSMMLGVTFDE